METPRKPNKQAGPVPASAFLHLRCMPHEKEAWAAAAKRAEKKLAEWVKQTLNKAAK